MLYLSEHMPVWPWSPEAYNILLHLLVRLLLTRAVTTQHVMSMPAADLPELLHEGNIWHVTFPCNTVR